MTNLQARRLAHKERIARRKQKRALDFAYAEILLQRAGFADKFEFVDWMRPGRTEAEINARFSISTAPPTIDEIKQWVMDAGKELING